MRWQELFERGAEYDCSVDDVIAALAERRDG